MPRPTKTQLADLAIKLFNNIDHGDQFANTGRQEEMFHHCDKAFLLVLIEDFLNSIKQNQIYDKHLFLIPEEELEELVAEAKKVLGITDDEDD